MKKSLLLVLVVVLFSAFNVLAQENSPPKVLLLVREEIKPGMMAAHARHSADFVGIFGHVQSPNHRIALVPFAGNENEVIYVNAGDSFSELEGITKATDKKMSGVSGAMKVKMDSLDKEAPAMHAGMRDILLTYRPELSFNPGVNIPQMRYFSITTTRVRPGYDAVYQEYIQKLLNAARTKAKVDNLHIALYQVVSGAPGGTYMSFRPMRTLAEMDDPIAMRVRAAMTDDQRKDVDKAVRDSIMSVENSIYAFAPGMSYVDQRFAAVDPDFWTPKPQMAAKPKPRKRAPKPPAPPPAN
ncbi:MAG TPA: hypothetical protein VJU86_00125 [Pyrinomonadaceae bacterium]|nr:hypothetical protein [Pyrinomonadaceae bacterium]